MLDKELTESQKAQLVGEVDKFHKEIAMLKLGFERQWWVNIAFYYGQQWLGYIDNQYLFNLMELNDGKVRMVINKLQVMVLRQIARIIKGRPQLNVIPGNSDFHAVTSAEAAEKLLNYLWDKLNVDQILRQAMFVMETCGSVYLYPHWDPLAGEKVKVARTQTVMVPQIITDVISGEQKPMIDPNTGQPVMMEQEDYVRDEQGNIVYEEVPIGEISIDIYTPFELYPNQGATSIENATKITVVKYRELEHIENKYGLKVKPETRLTSFSYYEYRLQNLFQANLFGYKNQSDGAFVKETWERPCDKYPAGRHYIVINDKVVFYEEILRYGDIPFIDLNCLKHPEKFWGDCFITQCIPLQKSLNMLASLSITNAKFMGNPKVVTYKNNGLQRSNFVADSGEILEVNVGGQAPYILQGAVMPPQVMQLMEYLEKQMADIFSQHEVSSGQLPYRIESAPALQELTEQDATPIALTVMDFEDQLAKLGRRMLEIVKNNYDDRDNRVVKVLGHNNELDEAFEFKVSDMIDSFDVRVKAAPGLPNTSAGKRDLMISLFRERLLNPDNPDHVRGAFELMQMPLVSEAVNKDQKAARLKIMLIKRGQGQVIDINDYDNYQVQAAEFANYMKTQDFLMLKMSNQQAAMQIQQYFDAMNQKLQAAMMAQQQQMMQAQAQGGGQVG